MADAIQSFGINIQANQNAFKLFNHQLPLCDVEQIIITWPAGCAGLVQVIILAGGNFAYPSVAAQAFEFDDYNLVIPVSNQINSGQWAAQVNNSDVLPHTIHVTYYYNYWVDDGAASAQMAVSA